MIKIVITFYDEHNVTIPYWLPITTIAATGVLPQIVGGCGDVAPYIVSLPESFSLRPHIQFFIPVSSS
jgi:hypothetical protein